MKLRFRHMGSNEIFKTFKYENAQFRYVRTFQASYRVRIFRLDMATTGRYEKEYAITNNGPSPIKDGGKNL